MKTGRTQVGCSTPPSYWRGHGTISAARGATISISPRRGALLVSASTPKCSRSGGSLVAGSRDATRLSRKPGRSNPR
eukprot:scaffold136047_cov151-Phaeocystis_antarctica.AAC.1